MLPDELRTALDAALARFSPHELSQSAGALTGRYRTGAPGEGPFLRTRADIAAYAAYRMPATFAAAATAMRQAAALTPGFAPLTQVDVGGGTGAAIWAAGETWPSLERITVIEHDANIIDLGRRLAGTSRSAAVRGTSWQHAKIKADLRRPAADLVTMSYALNELPEGERAQVVRWLAADAAMVIIIEPGTPAGYASVSAAREVLVGQGMTLVAPCPHGGPCPIVPGQDWCHFSVRLPRSSLHRRVKSGTLSFEDEKFSYLVATSHAWPGSEGRVVRHPGKRKGLVSLRLCTREEGLRDVIVSKRQGPVYQAARDVEWGDPWPVPES
ncbi:rRNA methyltransferase [Nonomuraea sp. NN258]|nr:rRNA methyltransferase [Nonomuraea antri]